MTSDIQTLSTQIKNTQITEVQYYTIQTVVSPCAEGTAGVVEGG